MMREKGKPGDRYWIVMGDAPPVTVEQGVIGPDGKRIPDTWAIEPARSGQVRDYLAAGLFALLIAGLLALAAILIGIYGIPVN